MSVDWYNAPMLTGRLPSPPTAFVGADGNPPADVPTVAVSANPPFALRGAGALPVRKRNRLKRYDYSWIGSYFITVCAKNKAHWFGHVEQGEMILNPCGLLVKTEVERVTEIRTECVIERFVIMPNHLHFILRLDCVMAARDGDTGGLPSAPTRDGTLAGGFPPTAVGGDGNRPANGKNYSAVIQNAKRPTISNMVQGFKGAVSRALGFSPWQRSFHDHIIRNDEDYARVARYIEENPMCWENDCFFTKDFAEGNH